MNEAATSPEPLDTGTERRGFGRRRRRRLLVWSSILVIVFVLYALSLGPVLRHYHARVGGGWSTLPPFVRTFYAPLGIVGGWLPMAYEHYIYSFLVEEPRP